MALSPQQETANTAVLAALKAPIKGKRKCIIVKARAGCGKTFLLVEIAKGLNAQMAPQEEAQFAAFNKPIADEIAAKLAKAGLDKRRIKAGTIHSIGFSAWRYFAGRGFSKGPKGSSVEVQVDDKKVQKLVEALQCDIQLRAAGEFDHARREMLTKKAQACGDYAGFVVKAVGLAKQRAFGAPGMPSYNDDAAWEDLFDHFGLYDELPDEVTERMG